MGQSHEKLRYGVKPSGQFIHPKSLLLSLIGTSINIISVWVVQKTFKISKLFVPMQINVKCHGRKWFMPQLFMIVEVAAN